MNIRRQWLWWAMLCVGAAATLVLFGFRFTAEKNDRSAAAAVFYDDAVMLAEMSGESENDFFRALSGAGVRYVLFSSEPTADALKTLSASGMLPAASNGLTGEGYAFYLPDADEVPDTELPLAMVENVSRTGVELSSAFDIDHYEGPMVKTLYLYQSYANRYSASLGGGEIENLLFRAVTDRGMRLLILTPFTTPEGELVAGAAAYTDVLDGLAERVEERGVAFGEGFSILETRPLQPLLMWLCSLLTAALAVWLLCEIPVFRKWKTILCLLAIAVLGGGWLFLPGLTQKAAMLASAVVFPAAGAVAIFRFGVDEPKLFRERPLAVSGIAALAALLACGLLGGAAVSALMSNRVYLMGGDIFSGVKAALMLPLALCFVLPARPMLRDLRRDKSLRRWLWMALALAVIAGVCLFLRFRSGDSGAISGLENRVRNFLEYTLYARPRTKELIFAAPSAPVFVWACRRKNAPVQLVCGIGACLECVSVVNTFCHAVAPIYVSVIRSLLAAGIGLVPGLVIAAALNLLFPPKGNKGAELN